MILRYLGLGHRLKVRAMYSSLPCLLIHGRCSVVVVVFFVVVLVFCLFIFMPTAPDLLRWSPVQVQWCFQWNGTEGMRGPGCPLLFRPLISHLLVQWLCCQAQSVPLAQRRG